MKNTEGWVLNANTYFSTNSKHFHMPKQNSFLSIMGFIILSSVNLLAQNSGTLLYTEYEGEILTLLAAHKQRADNEDYYLRGWATFGGKCESNESLIDCAIRETAEETNQIYNLDKLDEQLKIRDTVNDFTLYFKKVKYESAEKLNVHVNDERGPYAWVNLYELLDIVNNSSKHRIDLSYLYGLPPDSEHKWLYPKLADMLRNIPEKILRNIFSAFEVDSPNSNVNYFSDPVFNSKLLNDQSYAFNAEGDNSSNSSNTKSIIFDAALNKFIEGPPKNLKQDESLEVIIRNVNLFLFKVILTESQNDQINTEKLSESKFSNSFSLENFNVTDVYLDLSAFPAGSFKTNSNLRKLTDSYQELERQLILDQNNLNETLNRISELEQYDSEKEKLNNQKTDENKIEIETKIKELNNKLDIPQNVSIGDVLQSLRNHNDVILEALKSKKIKIARLKNQIEQRTIQIDGIDGARTKFTSDAKKYQDAVQKLNDVIAYYEKLVCILHTNKPLYEIIELKDELTNEFISESNLDYGEYYSNGTDLLDVLYKKLEKLGIAYESLSHSYISVKNLEDSTSPKGIDNVYTYIKTINASINHDVYRSFFRHIVKIYKLINQENFELRFRTNIVSDNADNIYHFINLIPIDKVPCSLPPQSVSFNYEIKIKNGIKIDSGPSLFANFGVSDNSYRFQSVEVITDTITNSYTKVIKESDQNVIRPTVGFLFNMYLRMSSDIKPAFNIGLSTDDIKRLNYHMGFALLFGQSERISISGGLTVGQVNYVADEYNEKSLETRKDANGEMISGLVLKARSDLPEEVPLMESSPFRLGGYVAFTFNLTGSKNSEKVTKITTF